MTQRERYLAIAVGGLLVAVVLSWGYRKYSDAESRRVNQIATLEQAKQKLYAQQVEGAYADRQMGEYTVRSLPSNTELAKSRYEQWLRDVAQSSKLSNWNVSAGSPRTLGAGLYRQYDFQVQGQAEMTSFVALLHAFYSMDYLHRIKSFSLQPDREGKFKLDLSVQAIGLVSAPEDLATPENESWRVTGDASKYRETILNRNFFEPPNQPPRFAGKNVIEAIVGRDTQTTLAFEDPEGHSFEIEFAETPPEFVKLDGQGILRVTSDQKREFPLLVRAVDRGYPSRSSEHHLTVKVIDPPPEPPKPAPTPVFDDASQTVLTALVQGRDEWTAWMHVRTRDTTLKLRVGDQFEVGTLKGSVVEVTPKFVMLEIDGRRFTLKPSANLSDAAKQAQED